MDAQHVAKMIFGIVGGLGIFLLGMKHMSDGMQAVAGARLRKLIAAVTNNRILATGVGTLVTCIIQSSSITTVMVVGLVNSGVMTLRQAIGVIMGANIGTTITGWILVLQVDKYGLPTLGAAAMLYLFLKGDRLRYWALFVMGLGMVFFGLELMKDACAVIKEAPAFEAWFQRFHADTYLGVVGCALVGCILTTLVQSSSATLGITISLASQGIISFQTAAALVLGENIGTTITALLASLGTTTNARRAAYFHVIFNVVGVFWITLVFPWYIDLIEQLFMGRPPAPGTGNAAEPFAHVTPAIAATHTVFNVTNTLLFLPLVSVFARLLVRIAPSKAFKEKPHLTDIDVRMLESPLMAIEQSRVELLKMGDGCAKMLDWLKTLLQQDVPDRVLADRLHHREKVLDAVQDEVTHFVTDLLSGNVPHAVAEEARQQMRLADEYESVSDYIDSILKFDEKLRKDGLRFTEKHRADLFGLHDEVALYLQEVNQGYRDQNPNILAKLDNAGKRIRRAVKDLREAHLIDLSTVTIPPQVSVAFMSSLNSYARVRDHAQNIAETIAGEK